MKKVLVLVAGAMLLAAPAFALITGSAHDFVNGTWGSANLTETEICKACHTPHNALVSNDILWNRGTTALAFTAYDGSGSSSDLNTTPGVPAGTSLLCFSCHDGTIAVDAYGGAAGTTAISGSAAFDGNMGDDHPIAFTYTSVESAADGELATPDNVNGEIIGLQSGNSYPLFGAAKDQFECSTCHDVHNAAGNTFLLNGLIAGSELCLDCHSK